MSHSDCTIWPWAHFLIIISHVYTESAHEVLKVLCNLSNTKESYHETQLMNNQMAGSGLDKQLSVWMDSTSFPQMHFFSL